MQINPPAPVFQTVVISVVLILISISIFKFSKAKEAFSLAATNQLKGLAILAIIFSHIGYFLSKNSSFLFPLSILAGVGVNLFLFLSGFGLASSTLSKNITVWQFYKRRINKLFVPLWIILVIFYLLDFVILHKSYPLGYMFETLLGIYRHGDLYKDINSPLWYFTLILFYYLTFPIVFTKRLKFFAPLLIVLVTYLLLNLSLPEDSGVVYLYKLHTLAFPIGVSSAIIVNSQMSRILVTKFLGYLKLNSILIKSLKYVSLLALLYITYTTALNSGVDQGLSSEQAHSIVTTLAIILVFLISRIEIGLLDIFGKYSYEIYLIHWPLLYRYDLIYKVVPAYLATIIYLGLFIALGIVLQRSVKWLLNLRYNL